MSDGDTITFNAWKVNDLRHESPAIHEMPPRLVEVTRSKEETPPGERKRRFLLPPGNGPFSVGSFDVMTDPSPIGSFFRLFYPIKKWDMDRNLSIEFPPWIPSRRYSAGFAKYMSLIHGKSKTLYMRFFEHERSRIYVPTLCESAIISEEAHVKELPIIIFSHGLSSCRTMSSSICMDWASYGFVVAAVEHRDGSAAYTYHLNTYPEGEQNRESEGNRKSHRKTIGSNRKFTEDGSHYVENGLMILSVTPFYDYGVRNHQLSHRRREMTSCLNALTLLNDGVADDFLLIDPRTGRKGDIKLLKNAGLKKMLKGRLNLNMVTSAGHSFGGATGLLTIIKDKRFRCGVVMDPWTTPLGPAVFEKNAFKVPFMMINSDKWLSGKKNFPFLRCLLADQVRVLAACPQNLGSMICTIRDTNHQSFTDFTLCCGPKVGSLLGLREKKDPTTVLQYLRQVSLAFVKTTLNLKDVKWPQGSKTILEIIKTDLHLDIKHGHRFISNHALGYEFEMQRLIAHERQAHRSTVYRSDRHTHHTNPSWYPSGPNGRISPNTLIAEEIWNENSLSLMDDPEFQEERRLGFKKPNRWCCPCLRREIRTVKSKHKKILSWSFVVPSHKSSRLSSKSKQSSRCPSGVEQELQEFIQELHENKFVPKQHNHNRLGKKKMETVRGQSDTYSFDQFD